MQAGFTSIDRWPARGTSDERDAERCGARASARERLAHLLADGTLRLHIQDTCELAQALDTLTALATTHTQGKLAIRVA